MIINLLEIVKTDHNKEIKEVQLDMDVVKSMGNEYTILEKEAFSLSIQHVKAGQILLKGETKITVEISCDRCVEPVQNILYLDIDKDINLSEVAADDQHMLEEKNYIDGYNLDVDKLLFYEILLGWPMKILCKATCEGVCNTCGQNLNQGVCECEPTNVDPRMSAIQDIFKNI